VLERFPERPADAHELELHLRGDPRAAAMEALVRIAKWHFPAPQMVPVHGVLAQFRVPWIETEGALAAFLGITPSELDWFADARRYNAARSDATLRHYHYRWVKKRTSGYRLLETPKPRLKAMQRSILANVLSRLPPSASAHGFVNARSVVSFVAPHVGQRVVVRLDLENYFTSITLARVRAIFRSAGYPWRIAHLMAALCCAPAPNDVVAAQPKADVALQARFHHGMRLRRAHLPQGAPTSPALSNLVAFRLDRRLMGLAKAAGASYTRYADDLAFSGDERFERHVSHFIAKVAAIALDEGFRVRYRKTRVMRTGRRQQLAGLVLNRRINVPRAEYDALRALLHNAAKLGPQSQNREGHSDFQAHLSGRIAWVAATNPRRGEELKSLYDRIDW
jgi:hypothetical protein